MKGALYKCYDKIDKVLKNPQKVRNLTFEMKGDIDFLSPTITLSKNVDLLQANYIRIDYAENLSIYYWITKPVLLAGGLIELQLNIDALYSFKDAVLNATAFIDRCEDDSANNIWLNDPFLPILTRREVVIRSEGFNQFDSTLKNYLVVTGGGVD